MGREPVGDKLLERLYMQYSWSRLKKFEVKPLVVYQGYPDWGAQTGVPRPGYPDRGTQTGVPRPGYPPGYAERGTHTGHTETQGKQTRDIWTRVPRPVPWVI